MQQLKPQLLPGRYSRLRFESLAVTKIDLFYHSEFLTSATGFFFRFGQTVALVTNWHVLSGVHPILLGTRDSRGYYPTRIQFHVSLFDNASGIAECRAVELTVSSEHGTCWFQNACSSPLIDIAWIDISQALSDFDEIKSKIVCIEAKILVAEDGSGITHGYPPITSEVFILGFPKGLQLQGAIPIWKRGTIASEPLLHTTAGPVVLVDTVTRDGMSGAPVLYFGDVVLTPDGKPVNLKRDGKPWLVGVYAGREGTTKNEIEMALGRVWQRSLLDASFFDSDKMPGLNPSRPGWEDFKMQVAQPA